MTSMFLELLSIPSFMHAIFCHSIMSHVAWVIPCFWNSSIYHGSWITTSQLEIMWFEWWSGWIYHGSCITRVTWLKIMWVEWWVDDIGSCIRRVTIGNYVAWMVGWMRRWYCVLENVKWTCAKRWFHFLVSLYKSEMQVQKWNL